MFQKWTITLISLLLPFLFLPHAFSQVSSDWQNHYGLPASERYLIHDGIIMTVFYSEEGRTCKLILELAKPQPPASFNRILDEIIPLNERGKEIHSIGLSTGPFAGISSVDYERVRIASVSSATAVAEGATTGNIISATIYWKGVQCRLSQHK